ncbi:MAG TPA: cytochrome P450 [Steroidobacteraceae bacterium]|nr:cytochrome P450 [Steroidobacteraceae bacterium]
MSEADGREDWDPRSPEVQKNQLAAYDEMRTRCPVAHSSYLHWSVFKHADVLRVLHDPDTFSSVVSAHLSVPSGMDPPIHTEYRRVIEPYFEPHRMGAFEPVCRTLTRNLLRSLPAKRDIELMSQLAHPFALEVQAAFLDWPQELVAPLREWTRRNQQATLSGDRNATAQVAAEFDGYIIELLKLRRRASNAADDVVTRLLREQVRGRELTDDEIVSILRNWTAGELSTIAASIGILVHYLAEHSDLQQRLRAIPTDLPAAIDEILRLHGPLISSRRKATAKVKLGERTIEAGERVTLMWASANRDEDVFGAPDEFRLDRNPDDNLLYGAGIHVCLGAPLARLELRVLIEELLNTREHIRLAAEQPHELANYPVGGFSALYIRFG